MTDIDLAAVVERALLQVAENVAKHIIQRTGSHDPNDACFRVDLRAAQASIMTILREHLRALEAEAAGLRKSEALLRDGMESQAEQMHALKQDNRNLKTILYGRDRQPAEGDHA